MARNYSSTARDTTLTAFISNSATEINVAGTEGFPAAPFVLVIDPDSVNEEIVDVTAVSGNTLTVTRGVDGSAGLSHNIGAVVRHSVTGRDFVEAMEHRSASQGVHGVSGSVVGTTNTQTLSNKTLEFPVLSAGMDANGTRINLLADPVDAQDAANKQWVEATASAITAGDAAAAAASAAAALVSEGNAAASEAAAAASELNAANSAAAAASALDSFDDRYLGPKTGHPTLDNDGQPLLAGALYFNTTDNTMYVYEGGMWIPASAASVDTFTQTEFVATNGQTVFTAPGQVQWDVGLAWVHVNGVKLVDADHTLTSTTLTLASPAAAGDDVVVTSFASFEIANAYLKSEADNKFETIANVSSLALDLIAHDASIGDTHGITAGDVLIGGDGISRIRKMTQAEYDLITPDPNTFYIIVG